MALAVVEFEPDAPTARPLPCVVSQFRSICITDNGTRRRRTRNARFRADHSTTAVRVL